MLDIMFQDERLKMSTSRNAWLYLLEPQWVKKLMSRREKTHVLCLKINLHHLAVQIQTLNPTIVAWVCNTEPDAHLSLNSCIQNNQTVCNRRRSTGAVVGDTASTYHEYEKQSGPEDELWDQKTLMLHMFEGVKVCLNLTTSYDLLEIPQEYMQK